MVEVAGCATGLVATIAPDRRYSPRCGRCLEPARYRDTRRPRRFRHVPLWGIAVELRYAPRRVRCPRCDGVHVESMPWVSGTQQMTRALMVTLATWARALPWQQVARLFRCSWGTVATAVEEAVAYGLAHRRACRVDALGQWDTADDPRADGDARDMGPGLALAAGRAAVPVLVGHRGHGRRGGGRLRPGASACMSSRCPGSVGHSR